MAEQTEVTYLLSDVIEDWISHSNDGYGPQFSDPADGWYVYDLIQEDAAIISSIVLKRYRDTDET